MRVFQNRQAFICTLPSLSNVNSLVIKLLHVRRRKALVDITYRAHNLEHHTDHLVIVFERVAFEVGDVSALQQKAHEVSTEVTRLDGQDKVFGKPVELASSISRGVRNPMYQAAQPIVRAGPHQTNGEP